MLALETKPLTALEAGLKVVCWRTATGATMEAAIVEAMAAIEDRHAQRGRIAIK